ncbi:MAG: inorganic pyrophosphatase [Planctomycetes bacterium]|nr:inorganic pyrophosphatase [Planctomycetota bacterium]
MRDEHFPWRPHPWHGLQPGPDIPQRITAFIEITPFDGVKYEVDKQTGYLRADRPQASSSLPPMPYGFVPRTYCGSRVGALMPCAEGGDRDPLDVWVLTERPISRSEILLEARVVGGIPMLDGGLADDKLVAVLSSDELWMDVREIGDVPPVFMRRLIHYLRTYKALPGRETPVEVGEPYGREHAQAIVLAAIEDYHAAFGPSAPQGA